MLVQQLHGHHQIEDHHYFPGARHPAIQLEKGFALLDSDHHGVGRASGTLRPGGEWRLAAGHRRQPPIRGRAAGDFLAANDVLARVLTRHLDDERTLIVPVILR